MTALSSLISPKVIAAASGAGAGSILSTLIVWLLGVLVFGGVAEAGAVEATLAAVPAPIVAFVGLALTVGASFFAGYQTTDPARGEAETPEGYEPRRAA